MSTEITIQIGRRKARTLAPASWNDLSQRDLLLFYNTLFEQQGPEHRQTVWTMSKLLSMAQHLLKLDANNMAAWEISCRAEAEDDPEAGSDIFADEVRQVVHAALGGLFEITETDAGATYAVKYNLTRNPYPRLSLTKRKKTRWLLGPADGLENITIYELAATFTAFENYLQTNDEREIDTLLATMYRPLKPMTRENTQRAYEGDRRLPYRRYESTVAERETLVRTLPPLVRRVIVFWFAGCRRAIVDAYPDVFSTKGGRSKNDFGWGATLLAVAGGPASLETVADQNFNNALTWLAMKQQEAAAHAETLATMSRKRQ